MTCFVDGIFQRNHRARCRNRRGAMMILIVVMLIAFLATVAFSVDIAYMHLTRTELRSATDAASKAASQELSQSLDTEAAINRGKEIALANTVGGQPLILLNEDFEFGRSERSEDGSFLFTSGGNPINSVRVVGRRTSDSGSGVVPLFFGNLFGFSSFEPQVSTTATYIERDVVLVVDRSGSMRGEKFADLTSAINVFVDTLADTPVEEEVGLASYNDTASEDLSLTTDLNQVSNAMGGLTTGGRTSISRGMEAGWNILSHGRDASFIERTMVVMTDGVHNEGVEPSVVANTVAAEGVTIHTITFGHGADQVRMQEVAQLGGGRHFHALTEAELAEAYREIALTLGTVMTE